MSPDGKNFAFERTVNKQTNEQKEKKCRRIFEHFSISRHFIYFRLVIDILERNQIVSSKNIDIISFCKKWFFVFTVVWHYSNNVEWVVVNEMEKIQKGERKILGLILEWERWNIRAVKCNNLLLPPPPPPHFLLCKLSGYY